MKTCPYSAEEIREEPIKCQHSGEVLSSAPARQFWLSRIVHRLWMSAGRLAKIMAVGLGLMAGIGSVGATFVGGREAARQERAADRVLLPPESAETSQKQECSEAEVGRVWHPTGSGPQDESSMPPAVSAPDAQRTTPAGQATVVPVPPDAEGQGSEGSRAREEPKDVLTYRTLGIWDASWDEVVRLQYIVRVSREPTEGELRAICNRIIEREKQRKPHNALCFLFFLPGTETDQKFVFTAGKAEWAPDGVWGTAGTVKAGDYSRHRLVVECGSARREIWPKPSKPTRELSPDPPVPEEPSWEELLSPRRPPLKPSYTVKYIVTFASTFGPACGGEAFVTYENDQGGTEQAEVRVVRAGAWEKTLFSVKRGAFLYLSAQNQGRGDIRATISVDGHVWKTSRSTGAYAIASCSGILGHE